MSISVQAFRPVASLSQPWRRRGERWAAFTAELWADLVRGPAAPVVALAEPTPPRYRHPERGLSWDGRGRQPHWLRDAVLQEGYLLAQLRCDVARLS